jgi:hypothetical protein
VIDPRYRLAREALRDVERAVHDRGVATKRMQMTRSARPSRRLQNRKAAAHPQSRGYSS